jgi:hypothetical protein
MKKVILDNSKYNDEWDAINMYQKRMAEERILREKEKDLEMRMRNRADLINQIHQKIKRKHEEELKDKEYAIIIEQNVKKMDELERKQKEAKKQQILKEKEIRDKQLKDIYIAKRLAYLKNKKYDKELIEHNNEEIRLEKEAAMKQKEREHEALLKTLKDNELHKKLELEKLKKEREEDIKMMQDAIASDLKKDNERKAYFNRIERRGNVFAKNAIENILKKREEKVKEDNKKLDLYLEEKERKAQEEENEFFINKKKNQKMIRDFYDKQVQEKKDKEQYEKNIDKIQAEIWKKDTDTFFEKEKETQKLIREFEKNNVKELDKQVKLGKYDVDKMTQFEKDYNYELLQKANELRNKKKCCCYYD